MELTRYWIEFKPNAEPALLRMGCGVTALGKSDAITLLQQALETELPPIERVVENVDIRSLDAGHVLPNMGTTSQRGIWFPKL